MRHAGQDTHIPRALLGSQGWMCAHTVVPWRFGWLAGMTKFQHTSQRDGKGNSLIEPEPLPDPHLQVFV